ncbi:unnamed protein product [Schistosoma margrebowiei]|uniref:Uncharacterized protein n=1 Tax=Schistosoma margrebowiei TaxID=48269 RepID=A0A183LUK3_9TREM|nr:unnamed protein product [Schistosoma margrebowiei]
MVVGGSQQQTLNLGFVLLSTRQQGVPVILRELVLPDRLDLVSASFTVRDVSTIVVGGSQQKTLDLGFVLLSTRQQGVPVILRELMLPNGLDSVSASFTVRDVSTGLFGRRPISCMTEM